MFLNNSPIGHKTKPGMFENASDVSKTTFKATANIIVITKTS